jgi:hypothetical protein
MRQHAALEPFTDSLEGTWGQEPIEDHHFSQPTRLHHAQLLPVESLQRRAHDLADLQLLQQGLQQGLQHTHLVEPQDPLMARIPPGSGAPEGPSGVVSGIVKPSFPGIFTLPRRSSPLHQADVMKTG